MKTPRLRALRPNGSANQAWLRQQGVRRYDPRTRALWCRCQGGSLDAETITELRTFLVRRGEYAAVSRLLSDWAHRARDRNAAAEAYMQAADAAQRAGAVREAEALYEQALQARPTHRRAATRLLDAMQQRGSDSAQLRLLDHLIRCWNETDIVDSVHLAELHFRLGRILELRSPMPSAAADHYRRALQLDPGSTGAAAAARALFERAGNLQAAAAVIELQLDVTRNADRRCELLWELALVRGERMGDLDGAIAALRRALALAPEDPKLLGRLAACLHERVECGASTDPCQDLDRANQCLSKMPGPAGCRKSIRAGGTVCDGSQTRRDALFGFRETRALTQGRQRPEARLNSGLAWVHTRSIPSGASNATSPIGNKIPRSSRYGVESPPATPPVC
ncbi:MAG: tetratricopeptide repeat protein [Proteobacteria bacterium]|nr:tetratricopeptide repeat protein [Pseudomonadota bacterium]